MEPAWSWHRDAISVRAGISATGPPLFTATWPDHSGRSAPCVRAQGRSVVAVIDLSDDLGSGYQVQRLCQERPRRPVMRRHVTSPSDENRHGFAPTVQHTRVSKNPYAAPLIQYTEQGSAAVRENPESYKGEILKGRTPEHSRGQRIVNKATRTRAISQSAF